MKSIFSLILAITIAGSFSHASYHGRLLGETQSEREIRWVWRHLNEFIFSCSNGQIASCQSPEIKATVNELLAYVPQQLGTTQMKSWESLLEFVTESERPDLFKPNDIESHRLAMTGFEKNSKVFINKDRMNLPIETWVGILVHEAIHHLGVQDQANRFPDQVGTAIAKHFSDQALFSSLEQYKVPSTRTVIFNSAAIGRSSVSVLSTGPLTSDIGWEPDPMQPVCNPNEKLLKQYVSSPSWKLNRIQKNTGIITVRGGGYIQTVCANASNQQRRTNFPMNAAFSLQYKAPLNLDRWMEEVPTPFITDDDAFGVSPTEDDVKFGQAQTFFIQTINYSQQRPEAGSTVIAEIVVKSIDNFQPLSCDLYVAGVQYSYIGQDRLPGINPFTQCSIKSLGQSMWQVTGVLDLPKDIRPDQYYIPMIAFSDALQMRAAIPALPTFFEVINKTAPAAPVIKSVQFVGLEDAVFLGTLPLTNSKKITGGQAFVLELTVEGKQQAFDPWLDGVLWTLLQTEFGVIHLTGSSEGWAQLLKKTETTAVSGGTKFRFTFQVPTNFYGYQIAGLKFRKLYFRTSDFSWVEIEFPGRHDHMVIDRKYGK